MCVRYKTGEIHITCQSLETYIIILERIASTLEKLRAITLYFIFILVHNTTHLYL